MINGTAVFAVSKNELSCKWVKEENYLDHMHNLKKEGFKAIAELDIDGEDDEAINDFFNEQIADLQLRTKVNLVGAYRKK